jgi:hypothetical protein
MKVWTSSEAMHDVAEPLRLASNEVEKALNEFVSPINYGAGVSDWTLIYILLPENDPNYGEIRRFHKRRGVVEFRLKVNHHAFKDADPLGQRRLLAAAIVRSIDLSHSMKLGEFDLARFRQDIAQVLAANDWVA